MKLLRNILLSILLSLPIFTLSVSADTGPKPSLEITFEGLNEPFYVTLLSLSPQSGPMNYKEHYDETFPLYEIANIFNSYEDKDGYYFLGYIEDCSEIHRISWNYFPPENFKILIYLPEKEQFIVSDEAYELYTFDSNYHVVISDYQIESVTQKQPITVEILSFLGRVMATLIVELLIALVFGFRSKAQLQFITFVNVITQILLNLVLISSINKGYLCFLFVYFITELCVMIGEGLIYKAKLKLEEQSSFKPFGYAVCANLASFIVGILIALA